MRVWGAARCISEFELMYAVVLDGSFESWEVEIDESGVL